jgi:hypothetical protein
LFATLHTIAERGWKDMQTDIGYRGYYNHLKIQDGTAAGQVRSCQVRSGQVESITGGKAEGTIEE